MREAVKLARLFGLAPGELGEVLASLAVAFACVGATGLSTIAGDALFVSAFSIADLSRFFVVSAIVRVVAALGFAAIGQRFNGRPGFDPATVSITAALLLVSGIFAGSRSPSVVYLVCTAQLILPPLLPLIAFNAAAEALDARAARRRLPLIAAASTLGSLTAGFAAGILSTRAGLGALFIGAALLSLVAVLPLQRLAREAAESGGRRPALRQRKPQLLAALTETARDLRTVPVVAIVVVAGFGGALLTNFVDFAFKSALKESLGRAEIAAYLGAFNVAANSATLLFQLVVTSRFVGRFGVRSALSSGPLTLALIAPATLFLPGLMVTAALRMVEFVFRYAIGNSIADLMIVPVPQAVRSRTKLIVKGAASPLGYLVSGLILSVFGGPDRRILAALVVLVAVGLLILLRGARDAYAAALASALGHGRVPTDVSPEAVRLYKSEIARLLDAAVERGDQVETRRALALMSDRYFTASDVRSALASTDAAIRRAAVDSAIRLTRSGDGDALLTLVEPDVDDAQEALVLAAALERGAAVRPERLERGLVRGDAALTSEGAARLWALSHTARLRADAHGARPPREVIDSVVKQLRKAALAEDSPKRAAALRALAELGEKRATREIQLALGSRDPRVFAEAARAAVIVEAPGAMLGLVANLSSASRAISAGRALALAGPRAVRELVDALPTTRGEGAAAATAVASARTISGTVRAARVMARIGPEASDQVLPLMRGLGYRARIAVAHAFGASKITPTAAQVELIEGAMEAFVAYAEALVGHLRWMDAQSSRAGEREMGLLGRELAHRIEGSIEGVLDLAAVVGDRAIISRARAALARKGRDRQNGLALLETVLPASVGRRLIALADQSAAPGDPEAFVMRRAVLDGWLERCRLFDAGELPSTDPMRSVLDRVLVLRNVELFQSLSAEELFPVAEIAITETFEAGDEVVRQGEAAEDLFALVEGECEVVKDQHVIATLARGQAFGELSVLDGAPRAATVRARTPAELLRIPRVEFETLLDESPELAKGVIKALLGYVRRR